MKNTFKRIAAFALVVCMLITVMPAVVSATEPAQLDSITYDFDLRGHEFTYESGDVTSTATAAGSNLAEVSNKGAAFREYVAGLYDTNYWKFLSAGNITSTASGFGFSVGATDVNYNLVLTASNQAGAYFAVTIQSPGTGDYELSLDYFTHSTGASQASVYVLPGSVTDIVEALEYYEPVGTFSCEGSYTSNKVLGTQSATFANAVSMKAGKDYILVFTNDAVSSANAARASLYLGDVSLNRKAPAQDRDTISYDIGAVRTEFAGPTTNINLTATAGAATNATINERYAAGTLTWKFHSANNYGDGTATAVNFNLNKSVVYGAQLVTAGYKNHAYYAMTVQSPGTGNYALTLNYYTHSTGAYKGSVYILPANTANIAAAIADGTAVGSFNSDSGVSSFVAASTTFDNVVAMEAGAEYLLVFTADEYSKTNTARATLYIDGVTMNRVVSLDEIEYDFDLGNITDAEGDALVGNGTDFYDRNLVGTGSSAVNRQNAVKGYYTDGVINWYYHSTSGSNFNTAGAATVYRGVYMQGASHATGCYFATVIRSPGPGTYAATVNLWDSFYGASAASVYLLPVGTEDIASALTTDSKVGTFDCDGSDKNFAADAATFDITFGAAAEYLLVFTNDAASVNNTSTRATLYVDSILLTNKAAGTEEETGAFTADGKTYEDFSAAVRAALDGDMIVTLNENVEFDEIKLPVTIDLNGNVLSANALTGSVIDSSEGNTGLLAAERDTVVFAEDNADVPLYDAAAGGYRLFDYSLELYSEAEEVSATKQKFWFKYQFRTSDAEDAALDTDAYALVAAGESGFQVAVQLTWNETKMDPFYFGRNDDVDAFSAEWAAAATESTWFYAIVHGLTEDMEGTLTVKPIISANNVVMTNGVITYTTGE